MSACLPMSQGYCGLQAHVYQTIKKPYLPIVILSHCVNTRLFCIYLQICQAAHTRKPKDLSAMLYLQNKRPLLILSGACILLLVPLTAMQFTAEVQWSFFDFVVAGVLLFGTGLCLELAIRKTRNTHSRLIVSILILLTLCIIWLELAVGVFGTPFAGS